MLLLPQNYKEALILAQRLKNIGVDRIIYDSGYDVKKFLKKERKNV